MNPRIGKLLSEIGILQGKLVMNDFSDSENINLYNEMIRDKFDEIKVLRGEHPDPNGQAIYDCYAAINNLLPLIKDKDFYAQLWDIKTKLEEK